MRSRAVSVLLVSLALILLISGCNGASPETRASQTRTAQRGTWTPTPRAREPVVRIDQTAGRDPDGRGVSAHRGAPAFDRTDQQDRPGGDACGSAMTDAGAHRGDDHRGDGQGRGSGLRRVRPLLRPPERCRDGPGRLPYLARCTADGRCRVGLIVSRGGRESFDVWLEVSTGLVKLIAQANT